MNIRNELFLLQDKKYAKFQSKLIPTIAENKFIGVRVPDARKLAKRIFNEDETKKFINSLPHQYYDENILHALLLSEIKDYDECINKINEFLPYVDNWAVCDIMSPKIFKKHKNKLITEIIKWSNSKETYTCRFGLEMLMTHFLDEDFDENYLNIPLNIKSDEYYVKMMIAWFYATALAKKWEYTITHIKLNKLDKWTHNKTIQKSIESYRLTDNQKQILKELKK